jgi:hypothetical protein
MSNKVIFFDAVNIFVVSKGKTTNAKISDGSTNVVQTYTFSLEQYMYVKSNAKVSMKEFFKLDKANCLDCPFSGNSGNGQCYTHAPVQYWGFLSMIRSINDSDLTILNNDKINKILAMSKDTFIRFGSYGEPSLMPIYLVDSMTKVSKGWTGYTHQYSKDWAKNYKDYFMASIESATEKTEWRAFRVLVNNDNQSNAVQCPASVEGGKQSNCAKCGLCSGLLGKGTKDVKILQH